MLDRHAQPERTVFVAQAVHHVRVGRHDLLVRQRAERADQALRHLLERRFVAEPAGDVARVGLGRAEHRIVDARLVQHRDERAQRALVAHVERAFTRDEQHVDRLAGLCDGRVQVDRPVVARGRVVAAHRARLAQVREHFLALARHRAVHERCGCGACRRSRRRARSASGIPARTRGRWCTTTCSSIRPTRSGRSARRDAGRPPGRRRLPRTPHRCRPPSRRRDPGSASSGSAAGPTRTRARGFALAALHARVEAQQLVPAEFDRLRDAVLLMLDVRQLQRSRRRGRAVP